MKKAQLKLSRVVTSDNLRQTSEDNRKVSFDPFRSQCKIFHKLPIALLILCFTDADECADGSHDCDVNADCNNTVGSYICSCKPTYFGNGKYCTSFREFLACHIAMVVLINKRTLLSKFCNLGITFVSYVRRVGVTKRSRYVFVSYKKKAFLCVPGSRGPHGNCARLRIKRPEFESWPAWDIVLCFWARHFTLTVPLSTQMYK